MYDNIHFREEFQTIIIIKWGSFIFVKKKKHSIEISEIKGSHEAFTFVNLRINNII